jgi:hypothetical protein
VVATAIGGVAGAIAEKRAGFIEQQHPVVARSRIEHLVGIRFRLAHGLGDDRR